MIDTSRIKNQIDQIIIADRKCRRELGELRMMRNRVMMSNLYLRIRYRQRQIQEGKT